MHDKAHYKNVSPKSMEQKNQSKSFGKIIHSTKMMTIGILLSSGTIILLIILSLKTTGTRTSTFVKPVLRFFLVFPAGITFFLCLSK